jgi:hypothetical protein
MLPVPRRLASVDVIVPVCELGSEQVPFEGRFEKETSAGVLPRDDRVERVLSPMESVEPEAIGERRPWVRCAIPDAVA